MKAHILLDGSIIWLEYPDTKSAAMALLRFQEYHEGEKFKGKIFTLGVFRQWYAKRFGSFSFYTDWIGFNFPDVVSHPFLEGLFDPLTPEEINILDVLKGKRKPFYVVATGGSNEALPHELCHAMFYLCPEYKSKIIKLLRPVHLPKFEKMLKEDGYNRKVFIDEMNAYIACDQDYLEEMKVKVPGYLKEAISSLREEYVDGIYK